MVLTVIAVAAVVASGWMLSTSVVPERCVALQERRARRRATLSPRVRLVARIGLGAALWIAVAPPVGVAVMAWAPVRRVWRQRASARAAERSVLAALPDAVDLSVVAAGAGLTVPLVVAAVASRAAPPIAAALVPVVDRGQRGERLADALDRVPALLGPASRSWVRALQSTDRDGTPLLPALERVALEVRADRRRRAEIDARKLPVLLLFPLVTCVLPAFVVLGLVPLLAGGAHVVRP